MKRESEISTRCNDSNQPRKYPKLTAHSKKKNFNLFLRRCARNPKDCSLLSTLTKKKKKSSSSGISIKEITKVSFETAILKSPTIVTGEVSKPSSWVKYQYLGKGSYGSVYLARSKNDKDKTITAIKSAEISLASSLMYEKKILTRLVCLFVVGCLGDEIATEKTQSGDREITNYNLILEYCSGESLTNLIKTNGRGLWERDVKVYARDILHGLFYIHSENIIHCDIKPDNILLIPFDNRAKPTGYLIRIADFGLAMEKGSIKYGDGKGHKRGTTRYMAPELMSYGILDYGVDIWAFGCTVLEMFTGKLPWAERGKLSSFDLEHLIGVSDCVPYIPDWLSEEARDFLSRCLVKEAGLRWGIRGLLDHPFVKKCA